MGGFGLGVAFEVRGALGIGVVAPLVRAGVLVVPDGERGDPGFQVVAGAEVAAALPFTFRYLNESAIIQPNVAISDSHGIALPLARDCLVAIGPAAKDDELLPEQICLFNRVQVGIGHRHVYYRPGSALNTFVRAML
jgi:hypothetical protein